MKKLLSFALFGSVFSQDCNNPLLAAYNLAALDQPQSGQGLPWCSNLQSGQTCCSSETVGQFQGLIQELVNSLENVTGTRDQSFVGLRNSVLDPYQDAVSDLTDNDDEINRLANQNEAVGNEIRSQWNQFNRITDQLSDLDDDDDNNTDNDDTDSDNDFYVYLQNLQVARKSCLNSLLDLQASLWCLACDPNYAAQGINSDGNVVISDALVNTINQNCYAYTVWSQVFNPLLYANQTIQRVRNLNDYLRAYGRDNNVLQNNNVSNDIYQPVNPNEKTVVPPPDCNSTNCPAQAQLLLSGASLNQEIAANGAGLLGGDDAILADIIQGTVVPSPVQRVTVDDLLRGGTPNVVLQNNQPGPSWNPNNNLSGLGAGVVGDPAQVSGLQENVQPAGVAGNAPGSLEGAIAVLNGHGDVNSNTDSTDTDD